MSFGCKKLVVIGAGLIGGSLIKALRKNNCEIGQIVAVGRNLDVLEKAKYDGFIDACTDDPNSAVIDADIVVMAPPVGLMGKLFSSIYQYLSDDCLVTDVGSVKASVVLMAQQNLNEKVKNFVPAHPVSGTEHSGFDASFAELFNNRYTVITPLAGNSHKQVAQIKQMWQHIGSDVLQMSVEEHDKIFAATSHLPHVLVYGLMNTIIDLPDSEKYLQVVAGGFLDYTRIASSDAVMWRDICLANKEPVLEIISEFKEQLSQLELMIENDNGEAIFDKFTKAKRLRDNLVDLRQQQKSKGYIR